MPDEGIRVITPREVEWKGCQLSILVPGKGRKIYDSLMRDGIFVDWREPDVVRLAPVPLYNRFDEVWHFAKQLEEVLNSVTR